MPTPIRFAILGFGHHASRRLVPAFARSKGSALTGLWRRNASLGEEDAEALGIRAFASPEELCASPEVDAVFITSPDAHHLADARLAFAHGKAVLCEKPVAMNAGQAQAMLEAAQQPNVLYGVGQNFRFNRTLEYLRDQLALGVIGTPLLARAQYCYAGTRAPRKWITDNTLAAGGPIADVGVHCLDSLRFILGDEFATLCARSVKDEFSGEVEAYAHLQLTTRKGTLVTVDVSARTPYRTLIEVAGSDGVLVAENGLTVDRPVEVITRRGGDVVDTITLSNEDGYVRMIDSFAAAMRGEETFRAPGSDGVINQKLLDAAYRSAHNGLAETL